MVIRNIEDYLEIILLLEREFGYARVSSIAKKLTITYPSVSEMVRKLGDLGYINYERYGKILLTDIGKRLAYDIEKRHNLWVSFLVSLGIDEENAVKDACRLEHDVSEGSMVKLNKFFNYLLHSEEGKEFLKNFLKKEEGGN